MKPTIEARERMILVGMSFYGDPFASNAGWTEENEIGRLWQRFMSYLGNNRDFLNQITAEGTGYELHIEQAETAERGYVEVFVGLETN